jgi:hypothetical protein
MARLNSFTATALVAVVFAVLLLLYLLVGANPWPLVPLVLLAAVGTDQVLRLHPQSRFHGWTATGLYLPVPVFFALGAALALGEVATGFWIAPAVVGAALIFAIALNAEYLTVDPNADTYEGARFLLLLVVYVTALAMFWAVLSIALPLLLGVALVGGTAGLLTLDSLRELEEETSDLVFQAGAVGLVMGETRLALAYLSLDATLAAAFMLIAFYVTTGLIQNRVSGRLDQHTLRQYGIFAGVGLLVVLGSRLLG